MKTILIFLISVGSLFNPINIINGTAESQASPSYSGESDGSVALQSFTLQLIRPGTVQIDWVTSSETNNTAFYLERSNDGVNFQLIATVDGAGTSQMSTIYQVIDHNPGEGMIYYKLLDSDYEIVVGDDLEL